jgi:hypothetical protein
VGAAVCLGRAGKVTQPDTPGSQVHVQIRETCGSQAARAFGIRWYMRLLERVFGLAQFGSAGRFAQVELAVGLQFARKLEQGMIGGIRYRRQCT